MEAISLYELNNRIKQTLKASFADSVWITAEITEVQLNRSGHCYCNWRTRGNRKTVL